MTGNMRYLLIVTLGIAANAHGYGKIENIENCAKLLPEGHQYAVSIQVNVDKTRQPSTVAGQISVNADTDSQFEKQVQPFVDCVGSLVKVEVEPISEEEKLESLKPLFRDIVY
ncbi:hypothetical protein EGH82_22915 [Vibrio ponticus]|uniref:Uncharacterized protein n=2 Tax=Vibrio ponticus TaxID=265668 RepID=A0A3N3DTE7_9VIBR|nr:hypothetical protein EGH82_22915 [Vibrio ponticus]